MGITMLRAAALAVLLVLAGCSDDQGGSGPAPDADVTDESVDAPADTGADAGPDTAGDTEELDVAVDEGPDAVDVAEEVVDDTGAELGDDADDDTTAEDAADDSAADDTGDLGSDSDAAASEDLDADLDPDADEDLDIDADAEDLDADVDAEDLDAEDTLDAEDLDAEDAPDGEDLDAEDVPDGEDLDAQDVPDADDLDAGDVDVPPDAEADADVPPSPGALSIQVLDPGGAPIPGTVVTLDGLPQDADDGGETLFTDLDPGDYVAVLDAPDHAPAAVAVSVQAGEEVHATVTLAQVLWRGLVDADSASTVGPPAVQLSLDSGALAQDALADVTYLAPVGEDRFAAPGPMLGVPAGGGDPILLDPLALADVRFSEHGSPVALADGATATLEVAVPDALAAGLSAGMEVPAWYFDLDSGVWREEGSGMLVAAGDGLAWQATVSHFTWWMPAFPLPGTTTCLQVYVHVAGEPTTGLLAQVTLYDDDGAWWGRNWTHTGGGVCFQVPAEQTLSVVADASSYPSQVGGPATVDTGAAGPTCPVLSSSDDCTDVDIAMAGTHCASGTVMRGGEAVPGAWVRATWHTGAGSRSTTVRAGSEGEFCLALLLSAESSVTAGDDEGAHYISTIQPVATDDTELACIDGICTALDVELPDIPDTVDCVVGRAFIDDSVSYSGLLPPVPLGTPVYLYDESGSSADPDCMTPTPPDDWGTLVGASATSDYLGSFCVNLPAATYSGFELGPIVGDCSLGVFDDRCPTGQWLDEGPGYYLGSCGTGLCYNLGAVSVKYGCPF